MLRSLAFAALLALPATSAWAAERYDIDGGHTQVQFSYSHFGYADITGRFDRIDGEFLFDAEDPTRSSITVSIPIDSVSTGVDKLDQHLQAADFFDVAQFPVARFQSHKVEVLGEGRLRLHGELTIRDVTKAVAFDVRINKIAEHPMAKVPAAGFAAETVLSRSAFGLSKYAPAVSDEVTLRISMETHKAK